MKILIVRFSSIGDIVLCSPVIRCLGEQSDAEIHFITKKPFAGLVENNPHIKKVWTFDKEPDDLVTELRAEKYDLVVDLHRNLRSLKLKWGMGAPSVSFRKLNWKKWLLVRFKINRMPNVHIVDRYMATLASLGVKYDSKGLDYFISEDDIVNPADYDSGLSKGNYTCLAIGANHATKQLPEDKLRELCNSINSPVVLLGGAAEAGLGASLEQETAAINLCGKLSIGQSASFIMQSKGLISHDTGMMHIGAALKVPLASVWGNTVPAFGMYPFFPEGEEHYSISEVKDLSCRPCSKIGFDKCPKGHFNCMNKQDVRAIIRSLESIPSGGD